MTADADLQLCRDLKAAIDARMLGRQVQSANGAGRGVTYSDMPVDKLIAYYRQVRSRCAAAQTELPDIQPLDTNVGYGPPAGYTARPWV